VAISNLTQKVARQAFAERYLLDGLQATGGA